MPKSGFDPRSVFLYHQNEPSGHDVPPAACAQIDGSWTSGTQ